MNKKYHIDLNGDELTDLLYVLEFYVYELHNGDDIDDYKNFIDLIKKLQGVEYEK